MATHRWLVSARWDLGVLFVPAWLTALVAGVLPSGATGGLWTFVLVVIAIDVAHVWSSLYRTYLQPDELRRRPDLYLGTPLLVLVGCTLLHSLAPAWFWTVMAYLAVFHFLKQQQGFLALYRLRQGLRWDDPLAGAERGAMWAVTAWPLVWWHAHLPRRFTWFVEGDFLVGLPAWVPWGLAVPAVLAVLRWAWLRRGRGPLTGRDLWLGTTALCYFVGIVLTDSDLGFTLTNVVLHGVPYLALVHLVTHHQLSHAPVAPLSPTLLSPVVFLGLLLGLALLEEALWDWFVWHDHPQLFGALAVDAAWLTPLLAVPQVTHYLLDRYLWRGGDHPEVVAVFRR